MLQHDSFGYNKIKKTNKKCCCIRKYCLVLNLPQYKTIFLIHLCLFNSRDISIDFVSTWPTFPIVMTTEQTNSLFRECTTIRALSSLYPKSVFGPPGRREPARACLCYHSGGGGKFRKVWCPGQFKLAECFPVFSLGFFWVSWVHFFFHFEYFTDGYALFQVYFCKTNNASFQRLRYFSDLGSKIEDIHIHNCCSTRQLFVRCWCRSFLFQNAWAISSLLTVSGAS